MKWLGMLMLGLTLLAACSSADKPSCDDGLSQESTLSGYRLGAGDRVRVTVFRQPDMSGEFTLDGKGDLHLPLVGELAAGGLTTRQLEEEIEQRLRAQNLLVDPQVSVQLLTYRPIYVLGEVNSPGSYEYREGMTVINAVALAGGYTYRADSSGVTIDRHGCRLKARPDTPVQPGDIITVPERFF